MAAIGAMAAPRATRDDEWLFLRPWLDVLRLLPHFPQGFDSPAEVRAVGDTTDSFWLSVALVRENELQDHDDGEGAALREIREAIVLTHLMASARYDLWFNWFVMEDRCPTPTWFIPEDHKVQLKYAFVFDEHEHIDAAFLAWHDSMAWLLGGVAPSQDFERDFARVQALLDRHGVRCADLEPIPIMLRCDAKRTLPHQADMVLKKVMRLVTATKNLQQEHDIQRYGPGVRFRVTALEMDLSENVLTASLLDSLQAVLQLGIDVNYLVLPELPVSASELSNTMNMSRVGNFMRTLLGIARNRDGRAARVRHLVMTARYLETFMFAPFCSALASARYLRVLQIVNSASSTQILDTNREIRRHAWSWLAFALLSSASTTRVETLIIDAMGLQASDVAAIESIVESEDPLATLCDRAINQSQSKGTSVKRATQDCEVAPDDGRPIVQLELDGCWDVRDGVFETLAVESNSSIVTGVLMNELEIGPRVFVPGFGLCDFSSIESMRPSKLIRVGTEAKQPKTRSSLQTLVVTSSRSRQDCAFALLDLLRLLGPRLKGLRIQMAGIDDNVIDHIFASCPRLENFALLGAELRSMQPFTTAYDRYNLHLSSLTLIGVSVPEAQLQRFLRLLLRKNNAAARLQRLKFGHQWPYKLADATISIVRDILAKSTSLTHANVSSYTAPRGWGDVAESYHGRVIQDGRPIERSRHLAFLGAVRRVARESPRLALNDDAKRLVFAFAACGAIRRVVISTWE